MVRVGGKAKEVQGAQEVSAIMRIANTTACWTPLIDSETLNEEMGCCVREIPGAREAEAWW
jgi:hypothetical protein